MRAATYARVSTQDQSDHGYSLPSQLEACRRYAESNGLEVTAQLSEDCSGATPMGDRDVGRALAAMVSRREVDAVVVHSVDRLSRDIVDLLSTVRTWLRAGVQVHAGDVGRIESELDIVLVIKGWQGSDERVKIRERTMRGKLAKAQAGHVVGTREPYGYKHVRDASGRVMTLDVYEPEAEVVRGIYRLYLQGDGDGEPLAGVGIARRLSEMGLPTPGEVRPSCKRTRAPGMWSTVTVLNILRHELYAGLWRYGGVGVEVPAIVDRATWEAAQRRRESNRLMAGRNRKRDYLLANHTRCACGHTMTGAFHNNHRYYYCNERANRHVGIEALQCRARHVRADAIEADVWGSVVALFEDLPELEHLLRKAQAAELDAMEPKRRELATIEAMVAECEQEADDIAGSMVKASGVVSRSLQQRADAVNQRHEAMSRLRDELAAAIAGARITDAAIRSTLEFAADIATGIREADYATKRRMLDLLDLRVRVEMGRYRVECRLGSWEGEVRRIPSARWPKGAIADSSSSQTSHNYDLTRMVWMVSETPCIIEQLAYTE